MFQGKAIVCFVLWAEGEIARSFPMVNIWTARSLHGVRGRRSSGERQPLALFRWLREHLFSRSPLEVDTLPGASKCQGLRVLGSDIVSREDHHVLRLARSPVGCND